MPPQIYEDRTAFCSWSGLEDKCANSCVHEYKCYNSLYRGLHKVG